MALKTVKNNDLNEVAEGAHSRRLRKPRSENYYLRISSLFGQRWRPWVRKRHAGVLVIPLLDMRSLYYSCNDMGDKLLLNFGTKFQC